MRELFPSIEQWMAANQPVALATVVSTWGSSPRAEGAKMAVNLAGDMTGSVSGGCVEGAVVEASQECLASGQPRLLHFGVADETAWEVGLACGGQIDVFVQPLTEEIFLAFKRAIEKQETLGLVTIIEGDDESLGVSMPVFEHADYSSLSKEENENENLLISQALENMDKGKSSQLQINDQVRAFVDVMLPPPRLIVVGGVHIAVALVKMAKEVGYQTIVVDPRRQFGTEARFPAVDQLVQQWPDEALEQIGITSNTAVAVLTHDPKLDDPGLMVALPSSAFYVGALGSRKTNAARRERLLQAGMSEALLDRLAAPIGLDLGGRSPEEIALAILAQIVQVRNN